MTSTQTTPNHLRKKWKTPLIVAGSLMAVYLLLVLAGGGWSPRRDDRLDWADDSLLLFAHRGARVNVPENSEPSLAEARRLGFPGVEIDVRKTKDGELALFHDKSARTMLGQDVPFDQLTLAQIKKHKLLLAGQETTNSVPTLREVFQKFGKTFRYYLDMKDKGFKDADQIVGLIDEFGLYERTILASVDPIFVAYVEHNYPRVNTALERFDAYQVWLYRLTPKRWKPDYLSGFARKASPAHARWLKQEQLLPKRIVYEADGANYDRMLKLGITKAIVDFDPAVHSKALSPPNSTPP